MGITAYLPDRDPEFISSWKGYQTFIDAIDELGKQQFPTILAHLPDGDEGETSPAIAAQMLAELDLFAARQEQVTQTVLVDSDREVDISMGSKVRSGTLTMDRVSGFDLGFDDQGFFVRDRWDMGRDLFRAMRVEQRLIHPEEHTVEYVDRDSGKTFKCSAPFGKVITGENGLPEMFLKHFHIEHRPTSPTRFAYILTPLRRVLETSVETDQVIRWG